MIETRAYAPWSNHAAAQPLGDLVDPTIMCYRRAVISCRDRKGRVRQRSPYNGVRFAVMCMRTDVFDDLLACDWRAGLNIGQIAFMLIHPFDPRAPEQWARNGWPVPVVDDSVPPGQAWVEAVGADFRVVLHVG